MMQPIILCILVKPADQWLTFPEMKSTAISPTDAFSKLLWSILQVFVLLWELTSVLAIIVGKETNPNSNMKLTIFKNNICFIKTKNDNTPLPKRPARKDKLNKRDWDLR